MKSANSELIKLLDPTKNHLGLQETFAIEESEFTKIVELITSNTGIVYQPSNSTSWRNAIRQRMLHLGNSSGASYLLHLRRPEGREEMSHLTSLIVVQKTSFFRNRPQFDFFESHALPEILANKKTDESVRIWSAGCSTGEEPYSLAILLRKNKLASPQASVLATDISRPTLMRAAEGIFQGNDLSALAETERNWFLPENGRFRLR
jgi:chemotaxis protein methyltransferase CheR